ncbi:hypothetical protein HYQ46_007647 [Verticillium longisporum]|nr:hypothetical protein HYQ46_007647 [Verticillium longisporum]
MESHHQAHLAPHEGGRQVEAGRSASSSTLNKRNGDMIHMPDGEEQENRDREMSQLAQTGVWKADTGPMFDAEFRNFLYNHNVIEHTKMVLDSTA